MVVREAEDGWASGVRAAQGLSLGLADLVGA
jgi:hypothetical protein